MPGCMSHVGPCEESISTHMHILTHESDKARYIPSINGQRYVPPVREVKECVAYALCWRRRLSYRTPIGRDSHIG